MIEGSVGVANPPASTRTGPIRMSLVGSASATVHAHDSLDIVCVHVFLVLLLRTF